MTPRRSFIGGIAAGLLLLPAAFAQPLGRVPRIGWLALNNAEAAQHNFAAFRQGLRERGWVEGRNIVIESRFADGDADRLPGLATELLRLGIDVLVAGGSAPTRAAKAVRG